ncbi:E3 SUMO-protein ligase ZBED1-like [Saccostrea cucullata]|uniref:E3 SUMO-protein ligase ZBED1-like n=1 Tax=Saccostrea cuccullata TaxID=36930 RepID=UPI002ED21713
MTDEGKKGSEVWKYFTIIENNGKKKVKCNLCAIELSYAGGSTGTMKNHIKFKHKSTNLSKPVAQQLKQAPITAFRSPLLSVTREKYQKITQKLALMCARDLRPLSIVEGRGFQEFCTELNPQFKVPSRTTVSNYVTLQYNDAVQKLKDVIKNQIAVAFTSDHWTSLATEGYITMTAHFVDDQWNYRNSVLATRKVTERHTGENTANEIRSISNEFGVNNTQICAIVTDNASNMVSCVEHLRWEHIRCFAHTLQLAIRGGFDTVSSLSKTIAATKKLVSHFRKSVIATNELHVRQKQMSLPENNLIIDCPTRWNSTFDMFERLQEQRMAVYAVLHDKKVTKENDARILDLSDGQWLILEGMITVLRPFYMATRVMCSEEYPTVSGVYPILYSLLNKHLISMDSDCVAVASFKRHVKSDLESRFSIGSEVESVPMLCSFLDPRYKSLPFLSEEKRTVVQEAIKSYFQRDTTDILPNEPVAEKSCSDSQNNSQEYEPTTKRGRINQDDMSYLLGEYYETDCEIVAPATIEDEIKLYVSEKIVNTKSNPFIWWKKNTETYKKLSMLARKLLCIPATSVSSERVFSTAGGTVTKLRASLDSDSVDKLVFLNKQLKQEEKIAIAVAQETLSSTPGLEIIQVKQEPKSPPRPNQETPETGMPSLPTLPTFDD